MSTVLPHHLNSHGSVTAATAPTSSYVSTTGPANTSGGSNSLVTKDCYQWWNQFPSPPSSSSGSHMSIMPPQVILPASTVQRKSRRCRCPNCLAGVQPATGKLQVLACFATESLSMCFNTFVFDNQQLYISSSVTLRNYIVRNS